MARHAITGRVLTLTAMLFLPCVYTWLKSFKVSFASEGKQRAMATNLIGDNLRAEMGAFRAHREGGALDRAFAGFPQLMTIPHNELVG